VSKYADDVKSTNFPDKSESFLLPREEEEELNKKLALESGADRSATGEIC
jgi:hypothetical protein